MNQGPNGYPVGEYDETPDEAAAAYDFDTVQPSDEQNELADLLASYELSEPYDIRSIGEVGYIVSFSGEHAAQPGKDWVMYDLDDTVIAYTAAKQARLDGFVAYAENVGLSVTDSEARRLIDGTDAAARWEEQGADTYHIDTHMSLLGWAVDQVREVAVEDQPQVLEQVVHTLQGLKDGPVAADEAGPRSETAGHQATIQGLRDEVFVAMTRPAVYEASLRSLQMLEADGVVNTALYTYGEPQFQLMKAAELAKSLPEGRLPVSQIWLTKVPKGQFLRDLAAQTTTESAAQDGLLGSDLHTLLLVDDNPKELHSIKAAEEPISQHAGAAIEALRLRMAGTKTADKPWAGGAEADTRLTVLQAADTEPRAEEIVNDIYIALGMKTRWRAGQPEASAADVAQLDNKFAGYLLNMKP